MADGEVSASGEQQRSGSALLLLPIVIFSLILDFRGLRLSCPAHSVPFVPIQRGCNSGVISHSLCPGDMVDPVCQAEGNRPQSWVFLV